MKRERERTKEIGEAYTKARERVLLAVLDR